MMKVYLLRQPQLRAFLMSLQHKEHKVSPFTIKASPIGLFYQCGQRLSLGPEPGRSNQNHLAQLGSSVANFIATSSNFSDTRESLSKSS